MPRRRSSPYTHDPASRSARLLRSPEEGPDSLGFVHPMDCDECKQQQHGALALKQRFPAKRASVEAEATLVQPLRCKQLSNLGRQHHRLSICLSSWSPPGHPSATYPRHAAAARRRVLSTSSTIFSVELLRNVPAAAVLPEEILPEPRDNSCSSGLFHPFSGGVPHFLTSFVTDLPLRAHSKRFNLNIFPTGGIVL